jgi:hypothetical protein
VKGASTDIKTLDTGKRNLVRTVTTVKRLHMLMAGVDQLGDMIAHHQYRPAARLLQVGGMRCIVVCVCV